MATALKGFRDMYPPYQKARRDLFDTVESVAQRFGFREIDTPSVESLELFEKKSGEDIMEETFAFTDKGGRDVTLVPEITPSVARMVSSRKDLAKPAKWWWNGKCWRYENPQQGRLREFYQLNCDIIGVNNVEADAEILATAATMLDELHLDDVCEIRIFDRQLLEAVLDAFNIREKEAVRNIIDKREKLGETEFQRELEDVVGADAEQVADIFGQRTSLEHVSTVMDMLPETETVENRVQYFKTLKQLLGEYGVLDTCVVDFSIVRGLDYYTGMVFEVFDTEDEFRAVFGGGRYDDLIGLFGGEDVPAVGFGMGDAVIEEVLKREGKWPREDLETDVYVAHITDEEKTFARELTRKLREEGYTAELDLVGRGLSNQLDYADRIGAELVLIVGPDELERGVVTVKDMRSGDEGEAAVEDLLELIAERL